jgi:acetoin utilization deacetylase AcuC-like enzyme
MRTAIFSHPDCLRHEMGDWHPESPERLRAIDDQLILARLDGLIEQRSAPLADLADVLRNHTPGALALVRDQVPAPATTTRWTATPSCATTATRRRCARPGRRWRRPTP